MVIAEAIVQTSARARQGGVYQGEPDQTDDPLLTKIDVDDSVSGSGSQSHMKSVESAADMEFTTKIFEVAIVSDFAHVSPGAV